MLRQSDESGINESVEDLTAQLREAQTKGAEAEAELKTAVEKIWELREVIKDLEQQVQTRSEKEDILEGQIQQLEEIILAQTKNQEELVQELELVKAGSENNHLSDHIGHLQEELRKAQLSSEQMAANSSALKQLRLEIRDLQAQLNNKTRELESMHVCGSSLSISQPSEDVSLREQIDATRCPTPDDPSYPPVLPLDSLLKLKESLSKHFRVEDVALKRLKDLDTQLSNLQKQNEELLAEQELLQQATSEQLFQIETLRARLEQQKLNAPFDHRQAISKLESQLSESQIESKTKFDVVM
ncbi:RUN and FYVE domain-containing protein 2-like [Copidosoma floridanum]|uniref:RUN and FYVE domain-containing protein 2-like n=1 Tax=Copidosoma floridanum TaxID=29053 RepID=UPI000C6F7714|nr:RUN and FYVE domain-containing protein 2-like [Copidosoma floridanum]